MLLKRVYVLVFVEHGTERGWAFGHCVTVAARGSGQDLVSDDVDTCRELPFCLVAGIRSAPRIPDAAGAYRASEQLWSNHWRA